MIELRAGDAFVGIDPDRGGRLASLLVGDRQLLLGPPTAEDRSIGWGSFLMAPWPGRLAGGELEWQGRRVELPRTHGEHAIHGLLWDRRWEVISEEESEAVLRCPFPEVWPWGGEVRVEVALASGRLTLVADLVPDGDLPPGTSMPAALGWHPWFLRRGGVSLRLEAEGVLATAGAIPTGAIDAIAGVTDLRNGPSLRDRRLDHAYVGARSPVVLAWPDMELTCSFAPSPATAVVFTPQHAVCVEPQTAWPNAFALPPDDARRAGARFLGAGEVLRATQTLSWREVAAPDGFDGPATGTGAAPVEQRPTGARD